MQCEEVRERLDELEKDGLSASLEQHLARCSACEAYARDWRLLREGFRGLAEDEIPQVSLGFAARVTRRVEQAAGQREAEEAFFDRVGRRVVYVTSLIALVALLALVLPSSGPLLGPSSAELLLEQPEVAASENDPIFAGGPSQTPAPPRAEAKTGDKKRHP